MSEQEKCIVCFALKTLAAEGKDMSEQPQNQAFMGYLPSMTLLDYFAGQALVGWLASLSFKEIASYDKDLQGWAEHQQAVAKTCYGYAEAMLAERQKREKT